jgi:hypothetical protein
MARGMESDCGNGSATEAPLANSIDNLNAYLVTKQTGNLIDAAAYANITEKPLNHFLSIELQNAPVRPQTFLSRFLKLVGDWLATKDVEHAAIWVLENPPGSPLNAHILLHMPFGLVSAFKPKLEGRGRRQDFIGRG